MKGCVYVKKIYLFVLFISLGLFLGYSFSSMSYAASVKEPATISIAWLPNNSGDNAKALREEFDQIIAKATGKKVENKLTTDYNIAMSALESGDAQLGYFGPWEYLVEHAKDPKIIPVVVESGDSGTLKDALYHSRFLVKKGNESQYKSGNSYDIDTIVGKKMSFVSTSSTSGFNMPAAAILGKFGKQANWKNMTKQDIAQSGKFFGTVLFGGSHQLSLVNLLTDKSDISAVDDIDVAQYVTLTSGEDNAIGAVYTVNKGADAPFDTLAGAQYIIIKSIPVFNTPVEANSAYLSQKTLNAIIKALTSDAVTTNPLIFAPKGSKGSLYVQPHRFLKVDDSWYDPMRKVLGL
ncbi:MAG TPA: phosphonate ABC transporter substrate-binding protein [Firmicutes bacterium]|jgi:phosphonate transport system substrate-binding protein|nr:phosphonate ABC transporter substrate-binding protein [Bacillota bacterium]